MTSKEFASEAEMCRAFLSAIPRSWNAYAETGSFDLLLIRKQDGLQIGVHAKLRLNDKVLDQACAGACEDKPGPDCRAVLVPPRGLKLGASLAFMPFTVIRITALDPDNPQERQFSPELPEFNSDSDEWKELFPDRRIRLPDYMPDVEAGAKSPVQLTRPKIGAIKLAITLTRRGYITEKDFRRQNVRIQHWLSPALGWIDPNPGGRFTASARFPDFRAQHPRAYAEIEADWPKWGPDELQGFL